MSLRPKLGELLVAASVIDQATLDQALEKQAGEGGRIGKILVAMGALDEEKLVRTVARQLDLPVVRLKGKQVKADVLAFLPGHVARANRCLPVMVDRRGGETLLLAMEDPSDNVGLDQIAVAAGLPVRVVLALPSELDQAIARFYPAKAAADDDEADAGTKPDGDDDEPEELLLEDAVNEITPPPLELLKPPVDPAATHHAAPELAKGGGDLGSDLDLGLAPNESALGSGSGGSDFGAPADFGADELDTGGPAWERVDQLDISANDLDPGGDIDEGPDPADLSSSASIAPDEDLRGQSSGGVDLMGGDSLDDAMDAVRAAAPSRDEDENEATGVGRSASAGSTPVSAPGTTPVAAASASPDASDSGREDDVRPRDAELRAIVALLIDRGLLEPGEVSERLRAARRGGA